VNVLPTLGYFSTTFLDSSFFAASESDLFISASSASSRLSRIVVFNYKATDVPDYGSVF